MFVVSTIPQITRTSIINDQPYRPFSVQGWISHCCRKRNDYQVRLTGFTRLVNQFTYRTVWCVYRSSEKAPLSSLLYAKLAHEAGIPAGIVQVLGGLGDTGRLLAEHLRIRKISCM